MSEQSSGADPTAATRIRVTGEGEYTVTVGRDLLGGVAEALGDRVNQVLIVHTPTVGRLADELRAVSAQAGNDVIDAFDGEHDATDAQRVRRCMSRLAADRWRRVELRQLDAPVAVRGPHHDDVGTDTVEPDDLASPIPPDGRLALQLHTKLGEKRDSCLEIVDNDEDVVHSPKRHADPPSPTRGPSWPLLSLGRSQRRILDIR